MEHEDRRGTSPAGERHRPSQAPFQRILRHRPRRRSARARHRDADLHGLHDQRVCRIDASRRVLPRLPVPPTRGLLCGGDRERPGTNEPRCKSHGGRSSVRMDRGLDPVHRGDHAPRLALTNPLTPGRVFSERIYERREWDSNPRRVAPHTLSKRADSAALASLPGGMMLVARSQHVSGDPAALERFR
jgi:hypothetical protein